MDDNDDNDGADDFVETSGVKADGSADAQDVDDDVGDEEEEEEENGGGDSTMAMTAAAVTQQSNRHGRGEGTVTATAMMSWTTREMRGTTARLVGGEGGDDV